MKGCGIKLTNYVNTARNIRTYKILTTDLHLKNKVKTKLTLHEIMKSLLADFQLHLKTTNIVETWTEMDQQSKK